MRVVKIKLSVSNAYLVVGKKSILVDTGAPNEAEKIIAAVKQAGIDPNDISLILHTHGHIDHAGSTAELKRRLGVPVAVHAQDAFMLNTGTNGQVKPRNLEARMVAAMLVKPFEPCKPDILIEEETFLSDFGVEGKVIFTPGHTKGSLSVILPYQEAVIGDVMMGGLMGGLLFGNRPNYHYFIDDLNAVHTSIQKILTYQPKTLYVGHGGPLNTEVAQLYFQNYIRA
jgi:glyoxylase-like metal-dependent hydrolase (beta-lactamase superfamily II)